MDYYSLLKHCSFVLMHRSCSMNNARGVGKKKKKKGKMLNVVALDVVPKRVLHLL